MENTQNKIYEIEDSQVFDQKIQEQDEPNDGKKDNKDEDLYNYGDQFDENIVLKDGEVVDLKDKTAGQDPEEHPKITYTSKVG